MNKACPVVLRRRDGRTELLAFEHPRAGVQIVKGTIEAGESLAAACVRELYEESGLDAEPGRFLGRWGPGYEDHVWGFHEMLAPREIPDTWEHFTEDGGGHTFRLFWHPLDEDPDERWHPLFVAALAFLREALAKEP